MDRVRYCFECHRLIKYKYNIHEKSVEHKNNLKILSCLDKKITYPARNVELHEYSDNGKLHRPDKPARLLFLKMRPVGLKPWQVASLGDDSNSEYLTMIDSITYEENSAGKYYLILSEIWNDGKFQCREKYYEK